jgi:two-component system, LytTR family, response regulator
MSNDLHARLRVSGFMFLYWLALLIALEPGNVLNALNRGHAPEFSVEALRIVIAALLGSTSAPLLIWLSHRFPLTAEQRGRNLAIHAGGAAVISFVLIVISCFLAAWILMSKPLPTMPEIRGQLAANWLLLVFALGAFTVLIQVLGLATPRRARETVPIKTRGRLGHLDLDTVEWIESQGNYVALHVGDRSHLIRETMRAFARRLDPTRFVRVHRRTIVDIHRIREIQPLANGDSLLILQDGHEIRASRIYREAVRRHWADVMASK